MMKRLKERETENELKKDLWKQEEMRRSTADKKWNAVSISVEDEISKANDNEDKLQNETNVSIFKLEETILKVQQKMAEGSDYVNYELKMREEQDKKDKTYERQKETNRLQNDQCIPAKGHAKNDFSSNKTRSPKKIKVRVEVNEKQPSSDKTDKKTAANTIVKLMVPFFKEGKIVSREVFKCCAREFTNLMLDSQAPSDAKNGPIPLNSYSKFVADFFANCGVIANEKDVHLKIENFKCNLRNKTL